MGMEDKNSENLSLEENFERLEMAIDNLERDDLSLEDAFRYYREGMQLLKQCNDQIDKVEKKVLKLTEEGMLEEFDNGER